MASFTALITRLFRRGGRRCWGNWLGVCCGRRRRRRGGRGEHGKFSGDRRCRDEDLGSPLTRDLMAGLKVGDLGFQLGKLRRGPGCVARFRIRTNGLDLPSQLGACRSAYRWGTRPARSQKQKSAGETGKER